MKAVFLVLSPRESRDLLNGDLSVLARKRFPSDYVGWVYIYVANSRKHYLADRYVGVDNTGLQDYPYGYEVVSKKPSWSYNGKVVARFWCDKVEEILLKQNGNYYTNTLSNNKLLTQSCLTQSEMFDYLAGNWQQKFNYWYGGYAIHITKLEPFDKPKEIGEFSHYDNSQYQSLPNGEQYRGVLEPLTRAPRSGWCYIEV